MDEILVENRTNNGEEGYSEIFLYGDRNSKNIKVKNKNNKVWK